jgi:DNA-binding NarL/FixJ family response regulator
VIDTVNHLTPRQLEVLRAYAQAGSMKIAAHQLGLSPATVRATLVNIRARLGVSSSVQAVMLVFGPNGQSSD